jgi:hypothetical protein
MLAIAGVGLRLKQYLAHLSLWRDEASLALNLIQRSFGDLMLPLEDDQGAPLGFLWFQKSIITVFGSDEYALRLLPLICSITAIFIFWFIASKYLSKYGTLLALTLFVLSGSLIEFGAEVKQFSSDVLISLLILAMFYFLRRQSLGIISILGYSMLGAILIWISHPAIFFLAAIGLSALLDFYQSSNKNNLRAIIIIGVTWVISFLIFYFVSLTHLTNNQYLLDFWENGFPPSLNRPLVVFQWIVEILLESFKKPTGLPIMGLGAFLYVMGAISLYKQDRIVYFSLLLPILFTLLAAFLGKYPFADRLILFVIPLLIIPTAEGTVQLTKLLSLGQYRLASLFLVGILLFYPLVTTIGFLTHPKLKEEIRPVMEHVRDNWQEGDFIYVYYGAKRAFAYYQPQYQIQDGDYVIGIESRDEWAKYLPDLNQLQRHNRVWLIFSHVHSGDGIDEEELFINWLDRTGAVQKDWFPRAGASSYLYEFPPSP